MSRILRRPMFRGGPVDSRGTGITTGLDQPRNKFEIGGLSSRSNRFFGDTGNVFTSGLALQPVSSFTPRVSARGRNINPPLPTNEFVQSDSIMTDGSAAGIEDINTGNFDAIGEDELTNVGDVELGLPKSKVDRSPLRTTDNSGCSSSGEKK